MTISRTSRNSADLLRPVRRVTGRFEAAQVRLLGRSVLSVIFRRPVLVLETIGRRTGRPRRTVLAYHPLEQGDLAVVGGAGGQTRSPDWVANLRADPNVLVIVARQRVPVCAVEVTGSERTELWVMLRRVWPQIDAYEQRVGREVPVFRLSPA